MTRSVPVAFLLLLMACTPRGLPIDKPDTGEIDDTGLDDTAPPEPVDEDGDGYTDDVDCDDSDPDVNPGADETEDGVDNDCDGYVDEIEVCDDDLAPFGEIQPAIASAADGDVVQVCPGTYYENLSIDGAEITVVSMEGPEVTIVDGQADRVWTVANVSDDGAAIHGFTIQNGAHDSYGAGVLCNQATLEMTDSVVTDCIAGSGAGMAASSCRLTLSGNTFSDNTATSWGGGAYLGDCSGDVTGNLFMDNSANSGGGLLVSGNNLAISENEFRSNYVAFNDEETALGGGLYLSGSSPITDNEFIDNESEDDGGGVYIYYGAGDFTGNLVQGNICWNDGAGVYTSVSSGLIQGNTFDANEAYDDAGGLRLYYGSSIIEDNELTGNIANDDGGGMKLSHSASNVIRDNHFEGNSTGDAGGGIELDNETSPVSDCVFIDNSAYRGGGLHMWRNEHGTSDLGYLEFDGNHATDCGGAASFDNAYHPAFLHNSTFTGNTANDGASVCADEYWWDADDDDKVDSMSYNEVYLAALTIDGDEAEDDGVIYLKVTDAVLVNLSIHEAEGPGSAVLAVKGDSSVTLLNSIISESSGAAALYVEESTLSVQYSDFWSNAGGNASGLADPVGTYGNIDAVPEFADAAAGDFTLDASSPCIDAGHTAAAYNDDDGSRNDMGAYGGPFGSW